MHEDGLPKLPLNIHTNSNYYKEFHDIYDNLPEDDRMHESVDGDGDSDKDDGAGLDGDGDETDDDVDGGQKGKTGQIKSRYTIPRKSDRDGDAPKDVD